MRWRGLLTAVIIGALVLTGCGDDDDDAAESTTTTTEDTTTTESIATTTTEEAATTTTAEPDEFEIADLEGSWEGISFAVTSKEDPALTVDAIAVGATVTGDVDDSGKLTGLLGVPEALGGGPEPIPFAASIELIDAETMSTTFEEEIPPFLTSFAGPFTYDGTTLALTDEEAVFDFADGAGPVPATAVIVLERV